MDAEHFQNSKAHLLNRAAKAMSRPRRRALRELQELVDDAITLGQKFSSRMTAKVQASQIKAQEEQLAVMAQQLADYATTIHTLSQLIPAWGYKPCETK